MPALGSDANETPTETQAVLLNISPQNVVSYPVLESDFIEIPTSAQALRLKTQRNIVCFLVSDPSALDTSEPPPETQILGQNTPKNIVCFWYPTKAWVGYQ